MVVHSLTIFFGERQFGPININDSSTFFELKELMIELLCRQGILSKHDSVFLSICIEYASLLDDFVRAIVPHERSRISLVIQRWVRHGPCRIQIHLMDFRRRSLRSAFTAKSSPSPNTSLNLVPKSGPCEAFSQLAFHRWPVSASPHEALFWALSDIATIQGKLARKIEVGRKMESWREDWFMLVHDRIWCFPIPIGQGISDRFEARELICPFFITLGEPLQMKVKMLDNTTWSLSFASTQDKFDNILQLERCLKMETMRAMSSEESKRWIHAIHALRDDNTIENDSENALFAALDAQIADYEYRNAQQLFQNIPTPDMKEDDEILVRLLLKQNLFRGCFQEYLRNRNRISILTTWSHIEDFRRGHPQSSNPYFSEPNSPRILDDGKELSIDIWCDKLRSMCDRFVHEFLPTNSGPEAFNVPQSQLWRLICQEAREFLETKDFRDATMLLAHHQTKKLPRLQKKTNVQSEETSQPRQLSFFSGFLSGSRQKTTTSSPVSNSLPNAYHDIIFASWRKSRDAELPVSWWNAVFGSESTLNNTSTIRNSMMPSSIVAKKNENDKITLDSFWDSIMKSLGTIHLISSMRCFFQPASGSLAKAEQEDCNIHETAITELSHLRSSVCFDEAALQQAAMFKTPTVVSPKTVVEPVIRKLQWFEESSLPLTLPGGQRQVAVFSSVLDTPQLSLFDPISLSLSLQIRLNDIARMGPARKTVNTIEIVDKSSSGFILEMTADAVHDLDGRIILSRWLHEARLLCKGGPVVHIVVKRGYLQKRGRLNTAFRWRWFELSSDLHLRYFKDDSSRTYKGQIDLNYLDINKPNRGIVRVDKEIQFLMLKSDRKWSLKDDNELEIIDWVKVISNLLDTRKDSVPFESNNLSSAYDEDEDEDEDP